MNAKNPQRISLTIVLKLWKKPWRKKKKNYGQNICFGFLWISLNKNAWWTSLSLMVKMHISQATRVLFEKILNMRRLVTIIEYSLNTASGYSCHKNLALYAIQKKLDISSNCGSFSLKMPYVFFLLLEHLKHMMHWSVSNCPGLNANKYLNVAFPYSVRH